MAGRQREPAQIGQGAEMGGVSAQHLKIGLFGRFIESKGRQQGAAFEQGFKVVRPGGEAGVDGGERRLIGASLVQIAMIRRRRERP
jgi:hypothetical protein